MRNAPSRVRELHLMLREPFYRVSQLLDVLLVDVDEIQNAPEPPGEHAITSYRKDIVRDDAHDVLSLEPPEDFLTVVENDRVPRIM